MKKYLIFALCCMFALLSCTSDGADKPSDIPGTAPLDAGSYDTDESDLPVCESLVAHAGGDVWGYRLTNSLEALDEAYDNGFTVIELDFERTSDGKYVLLHDWDSMAERMLLSAGVLTHGEFMSADAFASLTLMDLEMLLAWLAEHKECRIITDAKCGNDPFLADLCSAAGEMRDRFIPQAYSYEDYAYAKDAGFGDVILTLYRMGDVSADELTAFAEENKPWAVTIPKANLSEELLGRLSSVGIRTYAHTVNDLSFYEQWKACGLYGIYTDYFCPVGWQY